MAQQWGGSETTKSQGGSTATSRAIQSLNRALQEGNEAVSELDRQGEIINDTMNNLDHIDRKLNTADKTLKELNNPFSLSTPTISDTAQKANKSGIERPDLTGFLLKRGALNTAWKRRWFALEKGEVYYFKREEGYLDQRPTGTFTLLGATVETEAGQSDFKFRVVTQAGRTYELDAEDKKFFHMWVSALKRGVNAANRTAASGEDQPGGGITNSVTNVSSSQERQQLLSGGTARSGARAGGREAQVQGQQQQQQQQQTDLDTIEDLVGGLLDLSHGIAAALHTQDAQLDAATGQVDYMEERVARSNGRIDKFVKKR